VEPVIAPLYRAFAALLGARQKRGTLDLDIPERQVILGDDGKVAAIRPRTRWDSHRLIEEFMIAANVAAAEELEARRQPCMYRVHDAPDPAKVEALREFLETLDLRLARGQVMRPVLFARLLDQAAGKPHAAMVNELVLRSQSQAVYSPKNIGHFGLALVRYCHFTSPIRRYADLLVHRALVAGLEVTEGGLPRDAAARYPEIGEHVSATERRAAAAEREAIDRFAASYLAQAVGTIQRGRVTGVTRFGLFVRLDDSGADGLVPVSTLGDDFYVHDERRHALVGRRWGARFVLGVTVWVHIVDVAPLTGGILLRLVDPEEVPPTGPSAGEERKPRSPRAAPPRRGPGRRGRPSRRRG
jgi:ribonuclease R